MSDLALQYLASIGGPVLFVTLVFGAIGVPLPSTLLLIATGALGAEGGVDLVAMFAWATPGAIIGDQVGYFVGRTLGEPVERLAKRRPAIARSLEEARTYIAHWGGTGVFLTRWLLSPIGPAVNIAAGIAALSWPRFTMWSIAGEALWVMLFLALGATVGHGVEQLAALAGNLTWLLIAAIATAILGWRLFGTRRAGAA